MALDLMEKTTPDSIGSWPDGPEGERCLGRFLDEAFDGIGVVLHDRPVVDGAKRSTIDHLVIASGGVWVIDAYSDNHLLIGWSEQHAHVDGSGWQTTAVERLVDTMGFETVPVHRVLCFSDTDWARRPNAAVIDGVLVLSPDKLCSVARQPGFFRSHEVDAIASGLDAQLLAAAHH